MDPDQTVWSGSTLFVKEASNISAHDKDIRLFELCALRVNKCEFSVNIRSRFS